MRPGGDVLIVDDEQVVLSGAQRILEAEGLRADAVVSADAAIRKLRDHRYGLILTDLLLPGMDGIDLMLALRRRHDATPVVIVSGFATRERAIDSFKNGAFDFLPKPFDADELIGLVRRALAACPVPDLRLDDGGPTQWFGLGGHTLARLSDGVVGVRLGPCFAELGSALVSARLPEVGDELRQGGECVRLFAGNDAVHRVWSPLSGRVVALHDPFTPGLRQLDGAPLFDLKPTELETELNKLTRLRPGSAQGTGSPKEAPWSSRSSC